MSQTVLVRCPQGIQRLIDLGRAVARANAWLTHPLAREAAVGIWLDLALTRAEIAGTHETMGDTVNLSLPEQTVSVLDATADGWLRCFAAASNNGKPAPDRVVINVSLPGDSGEPISATVVLAAVAITGASAAIGAWLWKWQEGRNESQRNLKAGSLIGTHLELVGELHETAEAEHRKLTPGEEQRLADSLELSRIAIKNLTVPTPKGGLFGDLGATDLLLLAAAAAGLYLLTSRRRL